MKCDELKEYEVRIGRKLYQTLQPVVYVVADDNQPKFLNDKVYLKADADKVIANLKAKLENVQASAYADSVDAGMRECRLRRALWLARAFRARDIQRWWIAATCSKTTERACSVWNNVERKCRAKAEEYK